MTTGVPPILPVILSGGSGSRLWPLSHPEKPKQFHKLIDEFSLLQHTLRRSASISLLPPLIIGNRLQAHWIRDQAEACEVPPHSILLEPSGRNTAAAIAIAAQFTAEMWGREQLMLIMPADHHIQNLQSFHQAINHGRTAAGQGYIVTFGIAPTRPETGFGYIRNAQNFSGMKGIFHIAEFVEKPNLEMAQRYLKYGNYTWNSGIFFSSAESILNAFDKWAPTILELAKSSLTEAEKADDCGILLGPSFTSIQPLPFDIAIMQQIENGVVIPVDMGWNDIGSWPALMEMLPKDDGGNVAIGQVIAMNCQGSYLRSDNRPLAALGLENIIIVQEQDVTFVGHLSSAQDVKLIAEQAERMRENSKRTKNWSVHERKLDEHSRTFSSEDCRRTWVVLQGKIHIEQESGFFQELNEGMALTLERGKSCYLENKQSTSALVVEVRS